MPNQQYNDDTFKKAIALIRTGTPTSYIAKLTGVAMSTVSMWRQKYANVSDEKLPTFTDRYKRLQLRKDKSPDLISY